MQLVTQKYTAIDIKPIGNDETLLTFEPKDWNDVFHYLNEVWGTNNLYKKTCEIFDDVDKVSQGEEDPTPWCHVCGAMTSKNCSCGPTADNE